MVKLKITLLSTIYRRNIKSTGSLLHVLRNTQTTINGSLESWVTNLERTPMTCSQQLPAPYKGLTDEIKQN